MGGVGSGGFDVCDEVFRLLTHDSRRLPYSRSHHPALTPIRTSVRCSDEWIGWVGNELAESGTGEIRTLIAIRCQNNGLRFIPKDIVTNCTRNRFRARLLEVGWGGGGLDGTRINWKYKWVDVFFIEFIWKNNLELIWEENLGLMGNASYAKLHAAIIFLCLRWASFG